MIDVRATLRELESEFHNGHRSINDVLDVIAEMIGSIAKAEPQTTPAEIRAMVLDLKR